MLPARWRGAATHLALAAVAYLPLLVRNSPGRVAADTKTYLYLDPARLLARAPSMWDPVVGMGTVTHQNIGYLFPMGPYYWVMEQTGLPDWVAQRLWLGTLLFAAGAGVLYLLRTFDLRGAGATVAALAYLLSPYLLDYAARISVILMPWAALPWLVGLAVRALRRGGWRHPAAFAVTIALVGGVNATALLFAGVGPVLWFPYAVWVAREASVRRAAATVARIGVLTVAVSLWWIAGLRTQGAYGINILRYTETYEAVAKTSSAPEVLRGLGYWFFYGSDKLGPWIEPGRQYAEQLWLVAVGYAIPALAMLAALFTRWRHRAYFVGLLVIGTALSVGGHPYDAPSPFGRVFKSLIMTDVGMALRSTPRAVPLIVLAVAVLLGVGVHALLRATPRRGRWAAVACMALVVVNMPPLFTGDVYGTNLERDEDIPAYWEQAAAALDAAGHDTRVLELPGSDFASYRWGNTVDPVTPGLMDRPFVARELIPYGSPASADLLNAFDRRMQEGWFEVRSLAPFARLISAGTVLLRSDLQYERYRTPRPRTTWLALLRAGLGEPTGFGPGAPNLPIPRLPLRDEAELLTPANAPFPPEVATFDVPGAPPIVRALPAVGATVVVGNGDGLVDMAAAGLLDDPGLVLYAASSSPAQLADAVADGAHVVVTDTNRRQGRRWGTVRENLGATEQAGEEPLEFDPSDNRLPVFPDATDDDFTVAEHRGVRGVRATRYGNPVSFTPEDRAVHALDGDPRTAWRVGAFADVTGERLRVDLAEPVTTDRLGVLLPVTGPRNRWITRARLWFDGDRPVTVTLDERARTEPGQQVTFPTRTFTRLDVEILDTTLGRKPRYDGISGVGIAELTIVGADGRPVRADEVLRLPVAVPPLTADNRLTVLLTRQRANPAEPVRSDPEQAIARVFSLGEQRRFTVGGTVRVSAHAPDEVIDAVTGTTAVRATSSARLAGSIAVRASSAVDGDPTTAWQSPFGVDPAVVPLWNEYVLAEPVTFDRLDLAVLADGRHSVPTRIAVQADGGDPVVVDLPAVADEPGEENHVAVLDVPLPRPLTGSVVRFEILEIRPVETIDYYSEAPITMPVGIAEWGLPTVSGPATATSPAGTAACVDDLVRVDGTPVPVRLIPDAEGTFRLEGCGPLTLGPGRHEIRTAQGRDRGLDVDQLILDAVPARTVPRPPAPPVQVVGSSRTSFRLEVGPTAEGYWLVLGQSHNPGWRARAGGVDLGPPTLVQGYANGWYVPPGSSRSITLTWTPQRLVWIAIALSALALAGCLAVLTASWWRDRARHVAAPGDATVTLVGWTAPGHRPSAGLAIGLVVTFTALGGPITGAVVAAATVMLRRFPHHRRIVAVAPSVLMATVTAYVLALQVRWRLPAGFEWPTYFAATHQPAWTAVGLLATVVASETWGRETAVHSTVD